VRNKKKGKLRKIEQKKRRKKAERIKKYGRSACHLALPNEYEL